MSTVLASVEVKLERIPRDLNAEFTHVPLEEIAYLVEAERDQIMQRAQFTDFVPVLVHRNVRNRLREHNRAA